MITPADLAPIPLFAEVSPDDLVHVAQRAADLRPVTRDVVGIEPATRTVRLDRGERLCASTIILATGVSWRHLAIEGFDHLLGKGVYYGAARSDASMTQGLDVHPIGADAETSWLPEAIALDARGYVLTGDAVVRAGRWSGDRDPYLLECSVPGVFACGDVRSSMVKRVAAAVGEGSMAIAFIHQYLQYEASRGGSD